MFSEAVIRDLIADWRAHGVSVIERVREQMPEVYVQTVARLILSTVRPVAPASLSYRSRESGLHADDVAVFATSGEATLRHVDRALRYRGVPVKSEWTPVRDICPHVRPDQLGGSAEPYAQIPRWAPHGVSAPLRRIPRVRLGG